jgi:hypothetical protein
MTRRVPESEWEWFGNAGHFILGSDCRFHLNTLVGNWIISTVGEYFPDAEIREIIAQCRGILLTGQGDARRADYMEKIGYEDIGYGRKYETMVFAWNGKRCDCGCGQPSPDSFQEVEMQGSNDPIQARRGHMEFCRRYAEIESTQEAST